MFGSPARGSGHLALRLFGFQDIGCTRPAAGSGFQVIGDRRIRELQIGFASRRGKQIFAARCIVRQVAVGREK